MADELEAGATIANLLVEAAPALLLGYVAAGLLHAFAPSSLSRWLSGRSTIGASVRGALFGLPVPVCSCGALPLYRGLLARGAPPAAALAFLVAGPEVGASTLLVSVPLLGMHVTVLRLVAALAAAIMAGLLVGRMVGASPPADSPPGPRAPLRERLHEGLRFGLVETVDHTAPWVLAGLLLAGLIEPILTGDALHRLRGPLGVVSAALIGIPAYVCAAGATPLVAVLMHKGLSGGAAIAFLLTGPATNISTFGILRRLHGRPVAIWFGATVAGVAILLGWATDAIWPGLTAPTLHIAVEHTHGFLEQGSAAILVLLFGSALVRGGVAGFLHPLLHPLHEHSPTGACTHDHPHEHQPDPLPPAVPVVALSGYRFEAAASPSQGGVRGQSPCCHPHHGHDGCNGDHAKASPRPRRIAMGRFASRRSKEVGRAEEPPSEDKTD